MSSTSEATVIVNGVSLTQGQAMTMRVALSAFLHEMSEPTALGTDEHGRAMTDLYRLASDRIIQLMIGQQ